MSEPLGFAAKLPTMLTAVTLSFLLWIGLKYNQPPGSIPTDIPVGMVNFEQYQSRYSFPADLGTVALRIDGPQDRLRDDQATLDRILRENRVSVYVDFNDMHPGNHSYPLHLVCSLDSDFTFNLINKTMRVNVEPKSTRRFLVTIQAMGAIPDENLTYNGAVSDPSNVTVEGPATAVSRVKKVRGFLDLTQVTSSGYTEVALVPVDENDSQVLEVDVKPTYTKIVASVAPAAQSKTVLVEPAMSGHPAVGYELFDYTVEPDQIAVQGPPEELAKLQKIATEPVALSGMRSSTAMDRKLILPPGVKAFSVKSVKVQVTIKASGTTTPATTTGTPTVAGP